MIGPEVNRELDAVDISYNIRVLDGTYQGRVEIDGCYTVNNADVETVVDEIYPEFVDYFEERFEDAEIHSYNLYD